jgi:hypothetical protein
MQTLLHVMFPSRNVTAYSTVQPRSFRDSTAYSQNVVGMVTSVPLELSSCPRDDGWILDSPPGWSVRAFEMESKWVVASKTDYWEFREVGI